MVETNESYKPKIAERTTAGIPCGLIAAIINYRIQGE